MSGETTLPGRSSGSMRSHPDGGSDRVIVIVGATATGKSSLAIELARQLGGEIVNADSMQLYRGMDIGTAKLAPGQRGGVPHHLLDIWDVRYRANVAEYQALARAEIARIQGRGDVAILAGGSGLYVRAVIDDLRFPGTDPRLRSDLERELAELGALELHRKLAATDPAAAERIDPRNGRRIVRALEVVALTGSSFAAQLPAPGATLFPALRVGLRLDRPELDARIGRRVDQMWAAGLVAEVSDLADAGLRDGPTASQALGYKQVLAFLAGEGSEAEARAATITATRRFARRQESWFGRDPGVHWFDANRDDVASAVLRTLVQ